MNILNFNIQQSSPNAPRQEDLFAIYQTGSYLSLCHRVDVGSIAGCRDTRIYSHNHWKNLKFVQVNQVLTRQSFVTNSFKVEELGKFRYHVFIDGWEVHNEINENPIVWSGVQAGTGRKDSKSYAANLVSFRNLKLTSEYFALTNGGRLRRHFLQCKNRKIRPIEHRAKKLHERVK